MILCDTNIFIEVYRNNHRIISVVKKIGLGNIAICDVVKAELFFGARNKKELAAIKNDMEIFESYPISIDVSTMAVEFVKSFTLSHKLPLPDVLIAATSIIHDLELFTLNTRDFAFLNEMKLFHIPGL